MAMDNVQLANEIKSLIDEIIVNQGQKSNDEAILALATAFVSHIQANAQVVIASGSSAGTYNVQ